MPSPTDLFRARAEARAALWQAEYFTLHEAVDELQAWAEELGLEPDHAVAIMAEAFAAVREKPCP